MCKHFTHAQIQAFAALPLPFVLGKVHPNFKEVKFHIPTTPCIFCLHSYVLKALLLSLSAVPSKSTEQFLKDFLH